jgi:Bacterial Ig-like domain (group 3)
LGISALKPGHKLLVVAAIVVVIGLVAAGAFMVLPNKTTDAVNQVPGASSVKIRSELSKTTISLGESVTSAATVPGPGNGSPVPTGTVTFQVMIGSGQWTSYDTETLTANGTDGIANSSSYAPMSVDSYTFRATYSGDNNYPSSTSTEQTLNILSGLYATSVTPILSKSSVNLGQSVTESVTVPGLGNNFPAPTGAVTFQVMAGSGAWTTYDTENLTTNGTNGIATSVPYTPSTVGSYDFRAIYQGDDNYMTAQSTDSAAPLTVSLGSGSISNLLSQSSIGLGSSVIDSVTVPGPGLNFPAPTGAVTFQVKVGSGSWSNYDTESLSTNGTNGVANSTAYLPMAVGSYSFRVLYSGDSNNKASQTGNDSAVLTVNPGLGAGPVTTVLSQTTIAFGGSVTASVTVPGIGANFPLPTGSVEFQVKASAGEWTTYDNKTLSISGSNGIATSASYSPLLVDTYSFRTVYLGDSNYAMTHSGDNDSLLTVNPGQGASQFASTLSQTTITLGDSVTASVTVHGTDVSSPMPTGLIKFQQKIGTGPWTVYDTKLLSASGANAVAASVYAPTAAGAHYFRAVYLGDGYYMSEQSGDAAEPLTVHLAQGAAPTTVLSKNTADLGDSITASVTVPALGPAFPAPNGTVDFQVKVGSGQWTTFDTETLSALGNSGVATSAAYLPLNLGSYSFRAIYSGDSNYLGSQSADDSALLTVNPGQGSGPMTNALSLSTIGLGRSVTDTATVPGLSATSPVPSGSVTFQVKVGSGSWTTYDTEPLSISGYNGTATSASYLPLNLGSYSFRASYTGDLSYLASQTADGAAVLTVVPGQGAAPITDVLSRSTIDLGDSVSCNATVPGIGGSFTQLPTGTVKFQVKVGSGQWTTYDTEILTIVGTSGTAGSKLYKPTGGSYNFRVLYLGNSNYAAGQSDDNATHLSINQIQVNTPVLKVPKTEIMFGQNVSCTATVLRQGLYPIPTGTVDFQYQLGGGQWTTYETKTLLPRGPNGTAYADPFTPLSVGTYTFRVVYPGDWNYTAGQSAVSAPMVVDKLEHTYTETKLGVTSINLGQSVKDNVTVYGVNGSAVIPTGTVNFQVRDDHGNGTGVWVVYEANVPLVNRTATSIWYTPTYASPYWKFQAVYSGDNNYPGSHSCPWSEPVNVLLARSSISIDDGLAGATVNTHVGQSVTLNTTVTGLGYPPITGNVTFQWQLNGIGGWTNITQNVTLVNGAATSTWYTPAEPGRYIFRAVYNGDANYGITNAAVALQIYP